ncbi:MAG TPA: hypothetical protein VHS31_08530 [Tepidisphaeraceae bacterium]|nr:hypothetical protein [Tepidisphaeraceae bacterium]
MTIAANDIPQETDVLCPLCGYNLRGLVEARCPECGGQFNWDELRDPGRRLHPYLFEHHPEKKISSFFKTLVGGLRPRRFWTELSPVQPSRLGRMVVYWIICLLLASTVLIYPYSITAVRVYEQNSVNRQVIGYYYRVPGIPPPLARPRITASPQELANVTARYGSAQRMLDTELPIPPSPRFFIMAAREIPSAMPDLFIPILMVLGIAVIWPWAITLIMLIFRGSMKRSAVKPIHLLRIAIYSSDLFVWLGWLGMLVLLYQSLGSLTSKRGWVFQMSPGIVAFGLLIFALLLTYRLGCAMGKYLRFRHAMAMALSVQIILVLLIPTCMVVASWLIQ